MANIRPDVKVKSASLMSLIHEDDWMQLGVEIGKKPEFVYQDRKRPKSERVNAKLGTKHSPIKMNQHEYVNDRAN